MATTSHRGAILCVLAVGCDYADYTKLELDEPACAGVLLEPGDEVAAALHFTFDTEVEESGPFWDEAHAHSLLTEPGAARLSANTRIDGKGRSLELSGHQYARYEPQSKEDPLQAQDVTLSAWIALPSLGIPAGEVWPILSTLVSEDACSGYELALRRGPELASPELGFWYRVPTEDGCATQSLVLPLQLPSWALGVGRWHHVAASFARAGESEGLVTLYWDTEPLAANGTRLDGVLTLGEPILYVGTNGQNAQLPEAARFTGWLDELAFFPEALRSSQIRDFALRNTTRPGPAGCRWRALETWDEVATKPSVATWDPEQSSVDSLVIRFDDRDWGQGVLEALLFPAKDLRLYERVVLDATIPADKAFQFTLGSGDASCTWVKQGEGRGRYTLDLTRPTNCLSSRCEAPLGPVDRARLATEWAIPWNHRDERSQGEQSFGLTSLGFTPNQAPAAALPSYGGALGPRGWCWRLQAYEPESSAWWTPAEPPSFDAISVVLSGAANSGPRVVADFGEELLDLSGCVKVEIAAEFEASADVPYSFVVQDSAGSWRSWDLSRPRAENLYEVPNLDSPDHSSGIDDPNRTPNFDQFPELLALTRVRLLGIQKPWQFDGDRRVVVTDVTFFDAEGNPGCERPGPG